jgi:hypothetical protein
MGSRLAALRRPLVSDYNCGKSSVLRRHIRRWSALWASRASWGSIRRFMNLLNTGALSTRTDSEARARKKTRTRRSEVPSDTSLTLPPWRFYETDGVGPLHLQNKNSRKKKRGRRKSKNEEEEITKQIPSLALSGTPINMKTTTKKQRVREEKGRWRKGFELASNLFQA